MPRIDPIQLLKCLSVLLSPNGGIRSNEEVYRLASLMTKFSKKLVSKCIYIQILKRTETELLGSFMGSGGWRLAHMWLTESIIAKNWPLVRELLELLLLCPVDIDRLKTNNCPKLVKELSKDGSQAAIRALAAKLVEQWLKTVKGEPVMPVKESDFEQIISEGSDFVNNEFSKIESIAEQVIEKQDASNYSDKIKEEISEDDSFFSGIKKEFVKEEIIKENEVLPVLKISLKDGKQVISKLDHSEEKNEKISSDKIKEHKSSSKHKSKTDSSKTSRSSSKHSDSKSHSSKSSSNKNRSSSSSKTTSSSSKDKEKKSTHSSSSEKHKDKKSGEKSSSSHKSKDDKYEEKSHKNDKHREDKHRKSRDKVNNDKTKESNDKIKESSEKSSKDTLAKISNPLKLMKIPKISETIKKEAPSISIESRKPNDPNRPKTVKTFNSKFRSHGLEEEIKPPPPRGSVLKKTPIIPTSISIPKRLSPPHSMEQPVEKKSKIIEPPEKPGSIKLIPAKPKPALLLESDMFMDALNASATNKKEPKKRKRRISGSKDGNPSGDASPPTTPTAPSTSPSHETKSTPFRFYKDTLETEEDKEKEDKSNEDDDEPSEKKERLAEPEKRDSADDSEHVKTASNGLRGVLCYHKRKGPKKSIRWRPDAELEQIQYFELDETERVNVSKTFTDMKNLERVHEREAVQKARNLLNDDVMEVRTLWRPLIPVDLGSAIHVDYGKNSKEKEIQAARQKSVLQSLYLKTMIPDCPAEPDVETHLPTEPTIIPLDDVTGNPDTVSDFRNTPWPEPKGSVPSNVSSSNVGVAPMFPPISQFPGPFPAAQFGVGGYQGPPPGMGPPVSDWPGNMPPNVMVPGGMPPVAMPPGGMPPGPPGPMPPSMMMNPGSMPPGVMMPPDGMVVPPDGMFPGPNPMFPMPPDGFNMNMPPNMFPPGFPGSMPDNGPFMFGNSGNSRGGMQGRGASNQWRGGWDGAGRGRGGPQGGWKKAKCIHFVKKGSCRQGDSCAFQHPGVNCPY